MKIVRDLRLFEEKISIGEMLERLKRHAWKACKLLKGFAGSNPALSAVGIPWIINNKITIKTKRIINLKN